MEMEAGVSAAVMQAGLILVFIVGTAVNLLGLVIFLRRPALRTLSNRFVMSLLVVNLLATCTLLPLVLLDGLLDTPGVEESWDTSDVLCPLGHGVTSLVTSASVGAAVLIAADQFCAVMSPLHYHRLVTKVRAGLMLAVQWTVAIVMAGLSIHDKAGRQMWRSCRSQTRATAGFVLPEAFAVTFEFAAYTTDAPSTSASELEFTTEDVVAETATWAEATDAPVVANSTNDEIPSVLVAVGLGLDVWTLAFLLVSTLLYIVPLLLLTWMYVRIYSAARSNSERTRRNSLTHSASELVVQGLGAAGAALITTSHWGGASGGSHHHHPSVGNNMDKLAVAGEGSNSRAPSRTPSLRSTSSQIVHQLRYRISNASLFLYREEARAARISVLVLVALLVCWLPYHVILVLHALPNGTLDLPAYVNDMAFVAILLNSLLSPFLYAYRSRRVQREVRRLFGLSSHHQQQHGKSTRKVLSCQRQSPLQRRPTSTMFRTGMALTPEELLAALAGPTASAVPPRLRVPDGSPRLFRIVSKAKSYWYGCSSSDKTLYSPARSCSSIPVAHAAELLMVSGENSRSSFSSCTSPSVTADSDVSL